MLGLKTCATNPNIRTMTQASIISFPLSFLVPPGGPSARWLSQAAEAYPVTKDVRKPSTGSKTSWLMRGRMSMRVVSERYTMIFCVSVTAASSPASLRLFSRLGFELLPGAT